MNVSLTPELEKFIESEVQGGMYHTASEVVRAGLRLLKDDKTKLTLRTPQTLEELEEVLMRSAQSLDAGEGEDGREVMKRLRKHMATQHPNG